MKAIIKITAAIAIALLCLVTSCKEENLMIYNGKAQVYFSFASGLYSNNRIDSTLICFGYDDVIKSDSTLKLRVMTMGAAVGYDRPVSIGLVDTLSTAIQEDIEFLPERSYIAADSIYGWVWLKLKNSSRILNSTLIAAVKTIPNDYFYSDYEQIRLESEPKRKKANVFWIYFDAKNEMPNLWAVKLSSFTTVFAGYSRVKFEFICEVLGLTRDYFMYDPTTENPDEVYNARFAPYGIAWTIVINRRLDQYAEEHGERLKDEHGNEVKIGVSSIN